MATKWIMELKLPRDSKDTSGEWQAIHPTDGAAYEYDTQTEAENMLRICYPHQERADVLYGVRVMERSDNEAQRS